MVKRPLSDNYSSEISLISGVEPDGSIGMEEP